MSSGEPDGDRQRAPLAQIAHVDHALQVLICAAGTPSASSRSRASASSSANSALELRRVDRVRLARNIVARSWRTSTSRQPSAEVMPGFGGTSTVGIESSLRERRAVQRARAAEDDERELARVVAAPDRDQPNGVGHVCVRDLDDRARRLLEVEAERLGRRQRGWRARRRRGRAAWRRRSARSPRRPRTRLASVFVGCSLPRP